MRIEDNELKEFVECIYEWNEFKEIRVSYPDGLTQFLEESCDTLCKKCSSAKAKQWSIDNPILYDKPILNVKGKLSFWEFNPDELKNS